MKVPQGTERGGEQRRERKREREGTTPGSRGLCRTQEGSLGSGKRGMDMKSPRQQRWIWEQKELQVLD